VRLDFLEFDDAGQMCRAMRALPSGTEIVSMYARTGRHVAWFLLPDPEPAAEPVAESTPAAEPIVVEESAPATPAEEPAQVRASSKRKPSPSKE
jgi:hypothetical protein